MCSALHCMRAQATTCLNDGIIGLYQTIDAHLMQQSREIIVLTKVKIIIELGDKRMSPSAIKANIYEHVRTVLQPVERLTRMRVEIRRVPS